LNQIKGSQNESQLHVAQSIGVGKWHPFRHGLAVDPLHLGRETIDPDPEKSAENNQRELAHFRKLHCGQKTMK
jgi:hypothetical protein